MSEENIDNSMCEGSCEKHIGDVSCYEVSDPEAGYNWGVFTYCDAAVDEDKKRGLIVEPVDE